MSEQAQNAEQSTTPPPEAAPPMRADRPHAVASAGFWFNAAREHQKGGDLAQALLCMENAYNHVEGALCAGQHFTEHELPPRKHGWEHSEQVLVFYEAVPTDGGPTSRFSIAYYHWKPPFNGPKWTDFSGAAQGRTPSKWWYLPLPSADPGAELLLELNAEDPKTALANFRSIKRRFVLAQQSAAKHHEGDRAACARLDNFQNQVWGYLDVYSKKLGWGLTGIQPECWALLDSALDELVKLRADCTTLTDEVVRLAWKMHVQPLSELEPIGITVTIEPGDMTEAGFGVEHCFRCAMPTPYWYVPNNMPCCPDCSKAVRASQVPTHGECLCLRCKKPYYAHHRMPGPLKLRQLCDGTLVKLWAT